MRNIKAIIEYEGTNYYGFQKQLALPTIQGTLEECLTKALGEEIKIVGAGRTDAGAHALGQVINFKTSSSIPVERMSQALNVQIPRDIVIKGTEETELDFHAQLDSTGKHYIYRIFNEARASVFWRNYAFFMPYTLDEKLMQKACLEFIGTHNFKGFSASGSAVQTFDRTIYTVDLLRKQSLWEIHIRGNGFLYNMVRIIAGTLVEIARKRKTIEDLHHIFETRERSFAGATLPAHGLYLQEVYY